MNEYTTLIRLTWGDFPEVNGQDMGTQHLQATKKLQWLESNGFINDHFMHWQIKRNGPSKHWEFTVKFQDILDYSKEYPAGKTN